MSAGHCEQLVSVCVRLEHLYAKPISQRVVVLSIAPQHDDAARSRVRVHLVSLLTSQRPARVVGERLGDLREAIFQPARALVAP